MQSAPHEFYYLEGDATVGPCSLQEMWELLATGKISPKTLVARPGDKKWRAVEWHGLLFTKDVEGIIDTYNTGKINMATARMYVQFILSALGYSSLPENNSVSLDCNEKIDLWILEKSRAFFAEKEKLQQHTPGDFKIPPGITRKMLDEAIAELAISIAEGKARIAAERAAAKAQEPKEPWISKVLAEIEKMDFAECKPSKRRKRD